MYLTHFNSLENKKLSMKYVACTNQGVRACYNYVKSLKIIFDLYCEYKI